MEATLAIRHGDGSFHLGDTERTHTIKHFLSNLRTLDIPCFILTTSDTAAVEQALARWGLEGYFSSSDNRCLQILRAQPLREGGKVRQNLDWNDLTSACAWYVDNCAVACFDVAEKNPGIHTVQATLTEKECRDIIGRLQLLAGCQRRAIRGTDGASMCPNLLENIPRMIDRGAKGYFQQDCARVQSNSGVPLQAIFDLDNALAQNSVFRDLFAMVSASPQIATSVQIAREMSDEWWIDEFGGRDRIQALVGMLECLEGMGVECSICSLYVSEALTEGMLRVGLLSFFQRHDGKVRVVANDFNSGNDKGTRVRNYLAHVGAHPSHACFVDDEKHNIDVVRTRNPGIATVQCSAQGITACDADEIVACFAKNLRPDGIMTCSE